MSWCWGVFELPRQPPRGCRHTRRHPREVFRHRLWVPTGAQRQLQQLEQGLCWKRASRRRRRKAEEHYGGLDCSLSFKVCLVRNIGCELSLINKAWIDVKIVDWDIVRGSCTNWVRDRLSPPIAPYHHSIPILCFAFLPFKKLSHSTTILFRANRSIAQNSNTAQTRNTPRVPTRAARPCVDCASIDCSSGAGSTAHTRDPACNAGANARTGQSCHGNAAIWQ